DAFEVLLVVASGFPEYSWIETPFLGEFGTECGELPLRRFRWPTSRHRGDVGDRAFPSLHSNHGQDIVIVRSKVRYPARRNAFAIGTLPRCVAVRMRGTSCAARILVPSARISPR
ncbi:MAG TPA: hypothetical protein VGL02_26390, partial [Streptomyces sp.]